MEYQKEDLPEWCIELLHYTKYKLKNSGGSVGKEEIIVGIGDDLEGGNKSDFMMNRVASVLSEDKDDVDGISLHDHITTEPTSDGSEKITDVKTVGDTPNRVKQNFRDGSADELLTIEISESNNVNSAFRDELQARGITTLTELSEADPDVIKEAGEAAWRVHGKSYDDELAWSENNATEKVLTATESEDLFKQGGYDNEYDLLAADPQEVVDSLDATSTVTTIKVEEAQREIQAAYGMKTFTEADANDVITQASVDAPIGPKLVEQHLKARERRRKEVGSADAVVRPIEENTETVGDPKIETRDDLDKHDPEAVYVADTSINQDSPVKTGLEVLERNDDYDYIPELETETSSREALPVDENGKVVKPSVPLEKDAQIPLDQLAAESMANNDIVGLEGPRGCGKNYIIKYIAYKTNRGYRSFDCHRDMTETDLFGPLTPDEDGNINPSNRPFKEGLLSGDIIVLNEFSAMPPGVAQALHQLFNDGVVNIASHGEHIQPHPETKIVITKNPVGPDYGGNERMNEATKGRISMYQATYPDDPETEAATINKQINSGTTHVEETTIEDIVEYAHRTRKDQNSNWPTLSTRDVKTICEEIMKGVPPKGAIKMILRKRAQTNQTLDRAFEALGAIA